MSLLLRASLSLAIFGVLFFLKPNSTIARPQKPLIISIYSAMDFIAIRDKAERMTDQYIENQFRENPDLQDLKVNVLGERAGQIVPIFEIYMTRAQWENSPQIRSWVTFNQASFALLTPEESRGRQSGEIATVQNPQRFGSGRQSVSSRSNIFPNELGNIDLDETLLTDGKPINPQLVLNELD